MEFAHETVQFNSDGLTLVGDVRGGGGEGRKPAVVMCTGMGLIKEVWLPDYAKRLAAAGYVTLVFDYRSFGESEGSPRRRLCPQLEVRDAQNAISYLQSREDVDPERIVAFGVSLGASVATALAAVDRRVKATVALAGPGNLYRIWSRFPKFDLFYSKILKAREDYVNTGDVTQVSLLTLLSSDPDTVAHLEKAKTELPHWEADVTFESLFDLVAFNPESTVAEIAPRAIAWIYPENDDLIAGAEAKSMYAAANKPKALLQLDGATHVDIYRNPATFDDAVAKSLAFFSEHI